MDLARLSDLGRKLTPYQTLISEVQELIEWVCTHESYKSELQLSIDLLMARVKGLQELEVTLLAKIEDLNAVYDKADAELQRDSVQFAAEHDELEEKLDRAMVVYDEKIALLVTEGDEAAELHRLFMAGLKEEEARQVRAVEQAKEAFRQISKGLLAEQ